MKNRIESLYVHFPFCRHLCNYCDFYKTVPKNREQELLQFHQYLEQSYQVHSTLMAENNYEWAPLKTLYIGGGTPSLWGEEGAAFFTDFLRMHNLKLADQCEFTLEVNPEAWTESSLREWMKAGVNRFSLGVQSYQEDMLRLLDRVHSLQGVKDILAFFDKLDVNFSVDFMLGLPESEKKGRDVIAELKSILSYSPDHLSVYILTVKSNYTHFNKLPREEWIEKEFLQVSEYLRANGFDHYEVSNFARKGKCSEHNLSYWRSQTVAAFGPSATGFLKEAGIRYKWKTLTAEFEKEILNEEQMRLENVYMALRSQVGLHLGCFGKNNEKLFHELAVKWVERGHAIVENDKVVLTSQGFLMLDSLMDELFTHKLF